jgi:hypothetical protein
MTKLAREAIRPSDRKIVECLEWAAKHDARIVFIDGMISITVGQYQDQIQDTEGSGFVTLITGVREQAEGGAE